jgi:hypothetical protein
VRTARDLPFSDVWCKDCRYFDAPDAGHAAPPPFPYGYCRRMPPTPKAWPDAMFRAHPAFALWPVVSPMHGCGEWVEK